MAQALEAVESAVELKLKAGFGAVHELDGAAGIGRAAVSETGAGGGGELGRIGLGLVLVVEESGFEAGHANETPAGGGHGVDQFADAVPTQGVEIRR